MLTRSQIHGKAQRRVFQAKVRDICHLPSGVARYLYKELTGDETEEETTATKEKQAFLQKRLECVETFVLACGDAELIPDLRKLANANRAGETCFNEFWNCVH